MTVFWLFLISIIIFLAIDLFKDGVINNINPFVLFGGLICPAIYFYYAIDKIKSYSVYRYIFERNRRNIDFKKNIILKGNAYVWWGNTTNNPNSGSIIHISSYYKTILSWRKDLKKLLKYHKTDNKFWRTYYDPANNIYKIGDEISGDYEYKICGVLRFWANGLFSQSKQLKFRDFYHLKFYLSNIFTIKEDIFIVKVFNKYEKENNGNIFLFYSTELYNVFEISN